MKSRGESFDVERILDSRLRGRTEEFYIKWQDYPESENTWEPTANLPAHLVAAFRGEVELAVGCKVELQDGATGSVINKAGSWWYVSLDNQAGVAKRQKGKLRVLSPPAAKRPPAPATDPKLVAAFNQMMSQEVGRPWHAKENVRSPEPEPVPPQRMAAIALQLKREAVRVASEANAAILMYDKVLRLADQCRNETTPARRPLATLLADKNNGTLPKQQPEKPVLPVKPAAGCASPGRPSPDELQWVLARVHGLHNGQIRPPLADSRIKAIKDPSLAMHSGAYGKVFRGSDTETGRTVAVKKIKGAVGKQDIMLEICLLEALADECPQIVDYYGYYKATAWAAPG